MDFVQTQYIPRTKRLQETQGQEKHVEVLGIIHVYIKQYSGGPTAHLLNDFMLVQDFEDT